MIGLIHPGQGGVFPGMFDEFSSPIVKHTVEEASDILSQDIYKLSRTLTKEQLSQTENAQICVTVMNVAIDRMWTYNNGPVSYRAGHSVGEFSAYCAAGSFSFADMLLAVQSRANMMSTVLDPWTGTMIAVHDITKQLLDELLIDFDLEIAGYNAYDRFVVSGLTVEINNFKNKLDSLAIKNYLLYMSIPCHSKFMNPCVDQMAQCLANIKIVNNVPVVTQDGFDLDIAYSLANRIELPVHWSTTVENLVKQNVSRFVITGSKPGGFHHMLQRMFPDLKAFVICDDRSFDSILLLNT